MFQEPLVTVDSRHVSVEVFKECSVQRRPQERPPAPRGKPWYTSAFSWRRYGSPSEGADVTALKLDLQKQGKTEAMTRNTGNPLVCVNHPVNRHLRPPPAFATDECEMRLRLLELKGRRSSVSRLCGQATIGF